MKFAEPGGGSAEYRFKRGSTYVWRGGRWRRVAGWYAVWDRVVRLGWSLTRWWRPRTVTSAVDAERGVITLECQRWSWRRWRWE